jgi:hypothetical protein
MFTSTTELINTKDWLAGKRNENHEQLNALGYRCLLAAFLLINYFLKTKKR